MPSSPIVIVGAGVLGLSTAVVLQDKYPRLRITIVAAEIPTVPPFTEAPRPSPDYASMWAGAHLRPDGNDAEEHKDAVYTADIMRNIALRSPESGVEIVPGREVMDYMPENKIHHKTGDAYTSAKGVDAFRILDTQNLEAGGVWGCEYKTWILNVHVYCRWLLARFIRNGGNIIQKRLAKLDDAFEVLDSSSPPPRVVVNCSGRNWDLDPLGNVQRGQTVLVKNKYHKTATRHNKDGTWSFIIPRPLGGGTIVGGTKQLGDWGTEIRPQETKAILEAAAKYWPGFVSKVDDFEIIGVNVGLRPNRVGGIRIEREGLGHNKVVVHGYGAGPRGYELSWGTAEKIAGLVGQEISEIAKL
ncbi:hypothetical protein ACHAPJ_009529 [Fusarium lateritium]